VMEGPVLLPCPLCGGPAVRKQRPDSYAWAWIGCDKCSLGFSCNNEKDEAMMREAWNTRTSAPVAAEERVEAVVSLYGEHFGYVPDYLYDDADLLDAWYCRGPKCGQKQGEPHLEGCPVAAYEVASRGGDK
jgi:hypothetical protein